MKQTATKIERKKLYGDWRLMERSSKAQGDWEYVYDRKTGQPVPRLVGAGR